MRRIQLLAGACALCLMALSSITRADVKLPVVFGDNMVLQRNEAVPVWGWDDAGAEVTVTLGKSKVSAKADKTGKWMVKLPAMKAGGPHKMTVAGSSTVNVKNILFGEVWLCSGQSNMEWRVRQSTNAKEEIAAAKHPNIRHIKIPHRPSDKEETDVPSDGWQVCSPQTVGEFTGVGYFFGRHLQQELDVPIGLIGSNWGGTRIEPWTPPEGFKQVPALKEIADNLDDFPTKNAKGVINHQSSLALYNGMISPLVPYAIRGAIWYQGESNRKDGLLYEQKMLALIKGWRTIWNKPELPFYFVQIAPYQYGNDAPGELPVLWEAQTNVLSLPHTGMAVVTDVGNLKNIHPANKQDAGKRLALWALAKDYGQKELVYSGPLYKGMKTEGKKIRVYFDHVGSGLAARDGKALDSFTIAGQDGKFFEATATIDENTIVVSSPDVSEPKAVRFGWHKLANPNLMNKNGLPASPFRSDKPSPVSSE
ncbi:MAG: 9-O-acetylesterase [Planctomycetaceae bacterium]|jgi:sialate O-acetylesterase|nr:9-O-acetylesterase [Planctomycetaceae bacterium]MBT6486417.1 9-O-acetylesterase [Planctomycetaceae bacterium]MBT6494016.1 9-O-acetylesterase [Planctomycetaceae bacterium]